jgi:hypothetical protein
MKAKSIAMIRQRDTCDISLALDKRFRFRLRFSMHRDLFCGVDSALWFLGVKTSVCCLDRFKSRIWLLRSCGLGMYGSDEQLQASHVGSLLFSSEPFRIWVTHYQFSRKVVSAYTDPSLCWTGLIADRKIRCLIVYFVLEVILFIFIKQK